MVTNLVPASSGRNRLLSQGAAFSSAFYLVLVLSDGIGITGGVEISPIMRRNSMALYDDQHFFFNRKLLRELPGDEAGDRRSGRRSGGIAEPDRVGELQCTKDDILVHQQATEPMPSGIPTYTVNVLSTCPERSRCAMARIHLTCGWFSSARQINPGVLRRLRFNDCLLNNGRPLPSGFSVSFQYANTFPYSFSISAAECHVP